MRRGGGTGRRRGLKIPRSKDRTGSIPVLGTIYLTLISHVTRSWRNWQTRYFEGVVFTRRVGSSPTDRTIGYPRAGSPTIIESRGRGGMADALASGASDGNIVEVQVLSTAP